MLTTVRTDTRMSASRSLQLALGVCLIASVISSVSSVKPDEPINRSRSKSTTERTDVSRKLPVLDTSQMEIYEHPKSIQSRSKRQAYPTVFHGDINLTPLGHPKESGPWGSYTAVTVCSRTCGGGVLTETRECPPTSHCTGPKKRYVSCNIQDCTDPQTDFRAEQCAAYNDKPFEGKFYSWIPNTRAPIRCELSCIPQGENFFYRFKSSVVDGTKCDSLTNDVCVDGECRAVGCDKKLGSMTKEDKCRVCDGDGSSCKTVEGLFEDTGLEVGYNDIVTIPIGATSIVIQERRPTSNYLAIRNESDHYYLNGGWKIDFPQELSIAGTIFEYDRTKMGNLNYDKLTALGPTTEELTIVLLYQSKNVGVQYEYSLPLDETAKYEYRPGTWSECSVTCGQGVHTRDLQCFDRKREQVVENELCSNSSEPETNKTCNTVNCAAEWFLGDWEECSSTCGLTGLQYRVVYCQRIKADGTRVTVKNSQCKGKRPPFKQQCNRFACPEWHASGWSSCSKPCDDANQFRSVVCQSKREDDDNKLLPAGQCDAVKKPESQRGCNLGPCKGLKWVTTDWKLCKKCNDTTETREAHCEDSSSRRFPEEKCTEVKPTESRDCLKTVPCLYQWHASQWGKCSTTCGHGHQKRAVVCAIEENGSKLKKVDEFHCDPKLKSENEQNCTNDEECTGTYFTGPWTQCSASCSGGSRSRSVVCFDYEFRLDMTQCDESKKPNMVEDCNTQPCLACNETEFGCCPDEITPAVGLYFDGCSNCSLSEFGCCPDNVTNAAGADLKGCFLLMADDMDDSGSGEDMVKMMLMNCTDGGCNVTETEMCDYTDSMNVTLKLPCAELCNFTDSSNATLMIPCLNVTLHEMNFTSGNLTEDFLEDNTTKEIDCKDTEFGCCPDWYTPANGTNNEDCPVIELGKCHETKFGCCPDNVTLARGEQTAGCGDSSCAASLYGCCRDRTTIAFGPHYKGCEGRSASCENSDFGCCDDGKTAAQGPAGEGCADTCLMSRFGCCPDGKMAAKGPSFEGCGCTYAQYGCCPDGKTAATGPSYMGCPETCATSRYGCCPDGKTIAQGANREGCPCQFSRHGCCPDSETPAEGPNGAGCDDCRRSKFGCCPDQRTKATGPDYSGCPRYDEEGLQPAPIPQPPIPATPADESPSGDSASCGLTNDRGSCANYVLRWFYDIDSGSCTQFWYGGCEGNGNRFATEEQCQKTCISPSGDGVCYLPKITGPESCESVMVRWYYDLREQVCRPFHFRCNGNQNNFVSYDDCSAACNHLKNNNVVPEEVERVPVPDLITTTVAAVRTNGRGNVCEQIPDAGPCRSYYEQWYFDKNAGICQTFVYGGCSGNSNRFISKEKCEERCKPKESVCDLPADPGKCKGSFEKWYFEKATGTCVTFTYGGCHGNRNRFNTLHDCEARCVRHKTSPLLLPPTHRPSGSEPSDQPQTSPPDSTGSLPAICTLSKDSGSCSDWSPKWFYDYATGACDRFHYGGCGGNDNKFETQGVCESTCADKADLCSLPPVTGPCRGKYQMFNYDKATGICKQFVYGGCLGNRNRFDSIGECQQRCASTLVVAIPEAPQEISDNDVVPHKVPSGFVGVSLEPQVAAPTAAEIDNKVVVDEGPSSSIPQGVSVEIINGSSARLRWTLMENPKIASYLVTIERDLSDDNSLSDSGTRYVIVPVEDVDDVGGVPLLELSPRIKYTLKVQIADEHGYGPASDPYSFRMPGQPPSEPENLKAEVRLHGGSYYCLLSWDTPATTYGGEVTGYMVQWGKVASGPNLPDVWMDFEAPPNVHYHYIQPLDPGTTYLVRVAAKSADGLGSLAQAYIDIPSPSGDLLMTTPLVRPIVTTPMATLLATTPMPKPTAFRSEATCRLSSVRGKCRAHIPNFYYNHTMAQCLPFIYGGCGGNGNRFQSIEECEAVCVRRSENIRQLESGSSAQHELVNDEISNNIVPQPQRLERPVITNAVCKMPKDSGPCDQWEIKFYFDIVEGKCRRFHFGGCDGNDNNFATEEDCHSTCIQQARKLGGPRGKENLSAERPPLVETRTYSLPTSLIPALCELPKDLGSCYGEELNWYYNKDVGSCDSFMYSGCAGNNNRFTSEEACERACGVYRDQNVCSMEIDPGPCLSSAPKWYFHSATGMCDTFIYGGCNGNGNRFASREECEMLCKTESRPTEDTCRLPKAVGSCKAMLSRWFFDTTRGSCEEFFYGGCEGNSNNFISKQLCEQKCGSAIVRVEEDICQAERDAGPCVESVSMWYHDRSAKECKLFTYGGCRGNQNRFESKAQCEARCKVAPTNADLVDNREEVCRLEFQKGPCRAVYPRWYYDSQRQQCREFTYGGCYGNENNFETRELCERSCAGVVSVADNSTQDSTPHITAEASVVNYQPGSVIHIHCRTPRLSVKHTKPHKNDVVWFKDGKRVDETVSTRYHISKNGTLKIVDASGFDDGNYSCAARNGRGHISSPIHITVASVGLRNATLLDGSGCRDNVGFANCRLVVAAKLCDHRYYGQYCCHSCKGAGVAGVRRRFKA